LPPFIRLFSTSVVIYLFICGLHYAASRSNRIESKVGWSCKNDLERACPEIFVVCVELYLLLPEGTDETHERSESESRLSIRGLSEARELPFVIFLFLQEMAIFHFVLICLRCLVPFLVSVPSPPSFLSRTSVSQEHSLSLIHSAIYMSLRPSGFCAFHEGAFCSSQYIKQNIGCWQWNEAQKTNTISDSFALKTWRPTQLQWVTAWEPSPSSIFLPLPLRRSYISWNKNTARFKLFTIFHY
jgi:hypothetical protein